MKLISYALKSYIQAHPFDPGDPDCKSVLDQLYWVYAEDLESDLHKIQRALPNLKCI